MSNGFVQILLAANPRESSSSCSKKKNEKETSKTDTLMLRITTQ